MANIQSTPSQYFLGEVCEFIINFKQPTTNAPVDVINPQFKITQNNTKVDVTYLSPIAPTGHRKGEYKITFFSKNLTEGMYNLEATGFYPDDSSNENLITHTGSFQIFALSDIQGHVMALKTQLADDYPEKFRIDDPTKPKFTDLQLIGFLNRAVNFFNETAPVSKPENQYDLTNFPYSDIMLFGAEYYALNQWELLEIQNTINYSDDISFTIDRSPKIARKSESVLKLFSERVKEMKNDALWRNTYPLGIKSTRLPLRVLRSLSFQPYFSFFSTGSSGY